MKIYLVGGAVRDQLLQQPIQERDWVVVGAKAEQLLAQGYKAVGKNFPVFIHPKTGDEYALARTERKTAPGYKGFEFDTSSNVSLEDDLRRRDLTINAMARDDEGNIIDPYGGRVDLAAGVLRHVSPAFVEDPVRVLRIARFAARFSHLGFTVAQETLELMRQIGNSGELDHLVRERVWQEFEKALGERHPSSFFATLADCDTLKKIFPEISAVFNKENMQTLQKSVLLSNDNQVRFAAIMQFLHHDLVLACCQRFCIPKAYTRLAILTAQYREAYQHCQQLTVDELLNLFNALHIWHGPQLFQQFILACQSNVLLHDAENISSFLRSLYHVAHRAGDIQALLDQGLTRKALGQALNKQRRQIIEQALSTITN